VVCDTAAVGLGRICCLNPSTASLLLATVRASSLVAKSSSLQCHTTVVQQGPAWLSVWGPWTAQHSPARRWERMRTTASVAAYLCMPHPVLQDTLNLVPLGTTSA
jgi:hypothetical protein